MGNDTFVRVKAGSPVWDATTRIDISYPLLRHYGRKLLREGRTVRLENRTYPDDKVDHRYLEPWNDAEEWNGSAWVPKKVEGYKLPATVELREDEYKQLVARLDTTGLRDEIALKVLVAQLRNLGGSPLVHITAENLAAGSYRMADMMLAARSRVDG